MIFVAARPSAQWPISTGGGLAAGMLRREICEVPPTLSARADEVIE
jgi:hypothetical protein